MMVGGGEGREREGKGERKIRRAKIIKNRRQGDRKKVLD